MMSMVRLSTLAILAACVGGTGSSFGEASHVAPDVELGCQNRGGVISLRITLRNHDTADTAIVLGNILANGTKYLADRLALDVRSGPDVTRYEYMDPAVSFVAGSLLPWVVALPSKSEYTIVRPLTHFWSSGRQLTSVALPFTTRLSFTAPPAPDRYAISDLNIYQGQVTSDWLEIPSRCDAT